VSNSFRIFAICWGENLLFLIILFKINYSTFKQFGFKGSLHQYVNIDFKGIDEKESIRLRIFSLDGRIVYDKTTSTSGFSQAIDLTSFEKGVYLLEYEYSDVIEREKVIVQ
jgi:hypothetical protein